MKTPRSKARRSSRKATLFRHLEIVAYSRRTSALAYTVTLPGVTEAWVRKLIKRPRGVIIAEFQLSPREIDAVQRLVEVELDSQRFWYHFDGASFFREKQAMVEHKRRSNDAKRATV